MLKKIFSLQSVSPQYLEIYLLSFWKLIMSNNIGSKLLTSNNVGCNLFMSSNVDFKLHLIIGALNNLFMLI